GAETSWTVGPEKLLEGKEGTRMTCSLHSDSESSACVPARLLVSCVPTGNTVVFISKELER
nr:hypothetical protein [Tanacetum cinerariifolium]